MSTNILEYTYDYEDKPLDDKEAMEKYQSEKAQDPDALIILDELHCGRHWRVKTYKSTADKEAYFRKKVSNILERFSSTFSSGFRK